MWYMRVLKKILLTVTHVNINLNITPHTPLNTLPKFNKPSTSDNSQLPDMLCSYVTGMINFHKYTHFSN